MGMFDGNVRWGGTRRAECVLVLEPQVMVRSPELLERLCHRHLHLLIDMRTDVRL